MGHHIKSRYRPPGYHALQTILVGLFGILFGIASVTGTSEEPSWPQSQHTQTVPPEQDAAPVPIPSPSSVPAPFRQESTTTSRPGIPAPSTSRPAPASRSSATATPSPQPSVPRAPSTESGPEQNQNEKLAPPVIPGTVSIQNDCAHSIDACFAPLGELHGAEDIVRDLETGLVCFPFQVYNGTCKAGS